MRLDKYFGDLSLEARAAVVVTMIRTGIEEMKDIGGNEHCVWMYLGKLETLNNLSLIEESVYAQLKSELFEFLS